ncbi:MAG: TonB-dependent receptor [Cyclobacteriaceae bacterium]
MTSDLPKGLVFLFSFLMSFLGMAQEDILVNESFESKSLSFILSDLEEKYNFSIYYKSEWVSETDVSLTIENRPLLEALNYVLKDEDLSIEKLVDNVYVAFSNQNIGTKNYLVTLKGKVVDGNTNEPVANSIVRIPELELATVTDLEGNYSFEFNAGTYLITAKSISSDLSRDVMQLYENQEYDIEIFERVVELDDVVITGRSQDENLADSNPGKVSFTLESIRKLPSLMGETDISRIILSLPGVQTVGEGATGFSVRGGAIDQNLILMDGVPLYNSSHLLGFFSIFNPDLVNDFTVYKGNIPAQYGGKLSSVVSVDIKNPQADKIKISGGVGPVSNKAFINLPIVKEKLSVVVGGRYSDPTWILKSVDDLDVKKSSANFYDGNVKAIYSLGEKDVFKANAYRSHDFYDFGSDTSFTYSSELASLDWDHQFSMSLFGKLHAYHSNYAAELDSRSQFREFDFQNGISSDGLKISLDLRRTERLTYIFGTELKSTTFSFGKIDPVNASPIESRDLGSNKSLEFALFAENRFKINNRLELVTGLRMSNYFLKESNLLEFDPNLARSEFSILDTISSQNLTKLYSQLEPRLSANWRLSNSASLKGSYARAVQYEHLFSNSTASLPTDLWLPTSNNLVPAISDQFSIGLFKNFADNKWETSVELYYKNFDQINIPKTGAEILMNDLIEADILTSSGESAGIEFLVRKLSGKVTGWMSYFYSKTQFVATSTFQEEQINSGQKFLADFDRPHNLNFSANFQLSRLWSMSSNFVFNSGRPVTLPNSSYALNGVRIFNVQGRNNFRIGNNHRFDISFTLEGSNKKNKRWSNSFTFSIYNLYGRRNPFSVVTKAVNNTAPRTFRLSVLGNAIPSFTYNFKFE